MLAQGLAEGLKIKLENVKLPALSRDRRLMDSGLFVDTILSNYKNAIYQARQQGAAGLVVWVCATVCEG